MIKADIKKEIKMVEACRRVICTPGIYTVVATSLSEQYNKKILLHTKIKTIKNIDCGEHKKSYEYNFMLQKWKASCKKIDVKCL